MQRFSGDLVNARLTVGLEHQQLVAAERTAELHREQFATQARIEVEEAAHTTKTLRAELQLAETSSQQVSSLPNVEVQELLDEVSRARLGEKSALVRTMLVSMSSRKKA